ncbi:MAG: hypothetical protein PUD49_06340, partial [Collinsella sp.]|nr:hypothetical protein [Collinsella sp.]
RPDSFVTSYLPVVLRSGIIGLLGMSQKVYSLAAQSFRMRKKWGFQQGFVQFSVSFWPVGEGC